MDLLTVFRILLRRWLVFIPALILTAVTAGLLSTVDSATYGASGSVLIVPGAAPEGEVSIAEANPVLQPVAAALGDAITQRWAALEPANESMAVELSVETEEQFPILHVTVDGESPEAVLTEVQNLSVEASRLLRQLQLSGDFTGLPPGVNVRQLTAPSQAVPAGPDAFSTTTTLVVADQSPAMQFQDLDFVSRFLRERMLDDAVEIELEQQGGTAGLDVSGVESAPMLRVEASGPDAGAVLATSQLAIERLQQLLVEAQEDREIPEPYRATLDVLAYPLETEVLESNTLRIVLAVVALGILASVGVALITDAAVSSRRQRRRAREAERLAGHGPDHGRPVVGEEQTPSSSYSVSSDRSSVWWDHE